MRLVYKLFYNVDGSNYLKIFKMQLQGHFLVYKQHVYYFILGCIFLF